MTNFEESIVFSSVDKELEHWKAEAVRYREITSEVQQEMLEFRDCSEDIEKELEAQLEHNEKQMRELKQKNTSLTLECETLKERYEKQQVEKFKQVSDLQSEISKLKVANTELSKDVRELEQRNDDLERTNRVIIVSLDDFEQRLNQALERNAFLESELDEKDSLSVTVQRLRDEARDLHHELSVRQSKTGERSKLSESEDPSKLPTKAENENATVTIAVTSPASKTSLPNGVHPTPSKFPLPETPRISQKSIVRNGPDQTPLAPSARISALHIVGDLLRKVGALESKLASCRNFVHEQPSWHQKRTSSVKAADGSQPASMDQPAIRTNSMTKIRV